MFDSVKDGMHYLVDESRMLSGLSVTYGTANYSESFIMGHSQEVSFSNNVAISAIHPLQETSIYDLASLTKLFTSVLAIICLDRRQIDLDTPVSSFDPRFINLRKVALGDVLFFRASLQTNSRIDEANDTISAQQLLYDVTQVPSPHIRLYSDINAMVIRCVLESVTNRSYADLLDEYIKKPAGLSDIWISVPEDKKPFCLDYRYECRIADDIFRMSVFPEQGLPHDPKAYILQGKTDSCYGHAGLFSTRNEMTRFIQALLSETFFPRRRLFFMGQNRTGRIYPDGSYRQYLGCLCFSKHPIQQYSEIPEWMGPHSLGLSGFTGNHIALDPESGVFVLYLGNKVHYRITRISPELDVQKYPLSPDGSGKIKWKDGHEVFSSIKYVYSKDRCLGHPIGLRLKKLGLLTQNDSL